MIGNSLRICPKCHRAMELLIEYMSFTKAYTFKVWVCWDCKEHWYESIEK